MKEEKNKTLINVPMQDKKIYIFRVIMFLLILCICFTMLNEVVKRKYIYQKTSDFFNQKENFDVLFFGSSHVLNGIAPMELWNDYGIISYNMANHAEHLVTSYYNIQMALKETKPKLVVVDAFTAYKDEKQKGDGNTKDKSLLHNSLDSYPISYIKYLAIKDICNGDKVLDNEMEYLFNFSMYHSRWNELNEEDFNTKSKYEKGAELKSEIVIPDKYGNFYDINIYNGKETINMRYLRKIIEYCKENDIEILITWLPYSAVENDIAVSKYIQTICNGYNIEYLNFLSMNISDYDIDYADKNSHLNVSGARKITDYLGKYIMENYDISDQRKNEAYSFWYEDYNEYIDLKINNLKENKNNLNIYLMLLYEEKDIKYEIKISSKKDIKEGSTFQKLLLNLNNNYEINDEEFEEHKDKTIKITTYDNRNGELIDIVWF